MRPLFAPTQEANSFTPRVLMMEAFQQAVSAVSAQAVLPSYVPAPPKGRTLVLGAGKAAAAMASVLEKNWRDSFAPEKFSGLVVTRYAHDVPTRVIEVVQSGHPMPDNNGEDAARRMLRMAGQLGKDDLLIQLMSGGASSLMSCPAEGLHLQDIRCVSRDLLNCGASIREMNIVRKHMSSIAGGRLAAAAFPAKIINLIISDVPGDDPSVIGSGPTVGDSSTYADAEAVIEKYDIKLPPSVARLFEEGHNETIKPHDPRLQSVETHIIANPQRALDAAADLVRHHGFSPLILGHQIEGEAREVAKVLKGIAFQITDHQQPLPAPAAIISGGETTVTVKGDGKGGRNAEFLLASAIEFKSHQHIFALAADTDGIDGTEDNAGAILTPHSLNRAYKMGIDPQTYLNRNDGYGFFEQLGDLYITGPTRTNVNDFRIILLTPHSAA